MSSIHLNTPGVSYSVPQSLTPDQQKLAQANIGLTVASQEAYAATSSAVAANTVAETSLIGAGVGALTIPANTLKVGTVVQLFLKGVVSTSGNPNAVWRIKIGSAVAATSSSSPGTNLSNALFEIEALATVRSIGANGSIVIDSLSFISGANSGNIVGRGARSDVVTFDTTIPQVIDATYQWGTAAAGNTITCEQAHVFIARA